MKTIPYELNGHTFYLCLNGQALFDAYDKFGYEDFLTQHIEGKDKQSFDNTCWLLAKLAEQGELVGSGYPVVAILDMSDMWVTFNIKETLMPKIRMGKRLRGYVPALDRDVDFHITYIAPQADFATWAATRTQGGFDIRTFAVKAKPLGAEEGMRPGMSVLVDWDAIE